MEGAFERRVGRGRSISLRCLAPGCTWVQYDIEPGAAKAVCSTYTCPMCGAGGVVVEGLPEVMPGDGRRHLVVTVPRSAYPDEAAWQEYVREVNEGAEKGLVTLYRFSGPLRGWWLGQKVFVVWNGEVRGHQVLLQQVWREGFRCETTGRPWPPGWYLMRRGPFHELQRPVRMRGFQGVRYCGDFEAGG